MLQEDELFQYGRVYPESLYVANTGTINEFVRVSVHKYWLNPDGTKNRDLDPAMIELHFVNLDGDWVEDVEARTVERTVLYYTKLLYSEGNGESVTVPFTDTLKVNPAVATYASQDTTTEVVNGVTYTTIRTTYLYDGMEFCVEVKADGVQEHNAQAAIWSAWGRNVTVTGDTLSLN